MTKKIERKEELKIVDTLKMKLMGANGKVKLKIKIVEKGSSSRIIIDRSKCKTEVTHIVTDETGKVIHRHKKN